MGAARRQQRHHLRTAVASWTSAFHDLTAGLSIGGALVFGHLLQRDAELHVYRRFEDDNDRGGDHLPGKRQQRSR
jgi:hypothetical protein